MSAAKRYIATLSRPAVRQHRGGAECVAGFNVTNVDIHSGTGITVTTGATGVITGRGTFKVQCCIHPWMRTTVEIQ